MLVDGALEVKHVAAAVEVKGGRGGRHLDAVGWYLLKRKEVLHKHNRVFAFGLSAKLMPKALELLFALPTHPTPFVDFFF
jgi:hypothetical protein